ncbi:oxidoreductase [Streptomyces sp. NPDC047079]|uniref:oxidoreductase n=1 Tax=Streptomyces sp. NPDC047079 TaxID=3154607 RepID=UPI0033DA229F
MVLAAARDAAQMAQDSRLTGDVAEAISEAGFARHFVPERWGGRAGTFRQLLDAALETAEACASTSWCATLFAAHGRLSAYLPEEGQHDVWASSPDVRIAAAVVPPSGRATACDNGWRLTGSWGYASGIDWADWVLLASWTPPVDGPGENHEHRIFAVPRADVDVHHTWRSLGLRATGSNTVTAEDVFVPAHRSFTVADLATSRPGAARCHSVPYPMVAALMFAAPTLGAARSARSAWMTQAVERMRVAADGPGRSLPAGPRRTFAQASAEIHAAGLLLADVAERADSADVTSLSVAECRRDATAAAARCSQAVDALFRASGARGLVEGNTMQRLWHDVTAVTAHAALDADAAAEDCARIELGGVV